MYPRISITQKSLILSTYCSFKAIAYILKTLSRTRIPGNGQCLSHHSNVLLVVQQDMVLGIQRVFLCFVGILKIQKNFLWRIQKFIGNIKTCDHQRISVLDVIFKNKYTFKIQSIHLRLLVIVKIKKNNYLEFETS